MGLLRGVARTAVIAGTATHVSNNVTRRQNERQAAKEQQQYQQAAPAPAAVSDDEAIEQLKKYGELKEQGILTQAEFDAKKQQLLGL